MMVDFRKMISWRSRDQARRDIESVHAFSLMGRKGQAAELLRVAREIYDAGGFNESHHYSYDEAALLRVVPQIAKRLDPDVALLPRETDPDEDGPHNAPWSMKTDKEIADYATSCVGNMSLSRSDESQRDNVKRLTMNWNCGGTLLIAANTMMNGRLGLKPVTLSEKPDLEGFQVYPIGRDHVSPTAYKDTEEAAIEWVREQSGLISDGSAPERTELAALCGGFEVRRWDDNEKVFEARLDASEDLTP